MTLYDELVARGLIAQVTDEEEIKELINNGKATLPDETSADGRQPSNRLNRRRYSYDR